MQAMSPTSKLPVDVSLALALGCFRALDALHRGGFVLRRVVPTAFALVRVDGPGRRLIPDRQHQQEQQERAVASASAEGESNLMLLARRVVITDVSNARLSIHAEYRV